jgi:arginase family enzyme
MTRYTPMPPDNFGGLPDEHFRYDTSRAVIFPVPLERTTTFAHGMRNGPAAILAAGRNLALYGMDVVDLLPQPGDRASDFLAAKLVYKRLGYIFCQA